MLMNQNTWIKKGFAARYASGTDRELLLLEHCELPY
jgi:hypothetical protein